jgi:alpha-galactosidase
MLEVGNGGMSLDEYRSHFSLWAILAAPLIAGNDLRSMKPEIREMLTNREVIAVNQDARGQQGTRKWKEGSVEVWTKPLRYGSTAIGIFNRSPARQRLSVGWRDIGLRSAPIMIHDLWRRTHPKPSPFGHPVELAPHGVALLRVR